MNMEEKQKIWKSTKKKKHAKQEYSYPGLQYAQSFKILFTEQNLRYFSSVILQK